MNENKLTLDICFKYPNAKIVLHNSEIIKSIYHWIWLDKACSSNRLSDCKLILRPLSSLTDEEKHFIINNFFVRIGAIGKSDFIGRDAIGLIRLCSVKKMNEFIDHMRGLNIDFEVPSLQERGIATYE